MLFSLLFSILNYSNAPVHTSAPLNYVRASENKYDNGYSEDRYNEVLELIKTIYSPLIQDRNGSFHIMSDWSDGAVNMWAWKWGSEYWLEIPGGMARYHLINEEAFVLSICHELGHLLGGAPGKDPISYEGQSDYFASLKCMKRVMPQLKPLVKLQSSPEVKEACEDLSHVKTGVCERTLEGALSLSSYYAELEKALKPSLLTPSLSIVSTTMNAHPPAQCRLDTFYAGIECSADINEPLDFSDIGLGACEGEEKGSRPRCWFYN